VVLSIVSLCVSIVTLIFIYLNNKKTQKELSPSPARPAITSGLDTSGHTLVKTYVGESDGYTLPGWKFKCSCGTVGTATNAKNGSSLGSEENAVQRFMQHAELHGKAASLTGEDKYKKLAAEFEAYKEKCYCKDINSSLNV
jgi:hypothetical protein